MKRPALVLFDLMNTLLLHEEEVPYWHRLGDRVASDGIMPAAEFNVLYARQREWRHSLGTREVTLSECLFKIIPATSDRDKVVSELVQTFMEDYEAKTKAQHGVEPMLKAWANQTRLAVISNFFQPGFPERLLKAQELLQYFEFVIDSAQVGFRKPASEIFMVALRRARIDSREIPRVFFIGDDWVSDMEGAKEVGMTPIHYSDQESPQRGVSRIRNWEEFRPPTA